MNSGHMRDPAARRTLRTIIESSHSSCHRVEADRDSFRNELTLSRILTCDRSVRQCDSATGDANAQCGSTLEIYTRVARRDRRLCRSEPKKSLTAFSRSAFASILTSDKRRVRGRALPQACSNRTTGVDVRSGRRSLAVGQIWRPKNVVIYRDHDDHDVTGSANYPIANYSRVSRAPCATNDVRPPT